ncbi:MAG: bacteriophage holin [Candidatus Aenigmatarchaeota archaeon]
MADKLDPWALGAAAGIVFVICVVSLGIGANFDYGGQWVELLANVYLGFDTDVAGILIGSLWAFVDGVIGGALLATFYNFLSDRMQD